MTQDTGGDLLFFSNRQPVQSGDLEARILEKTSRIAIVDRLTLVSDEMNDEAAEIRILQMIQPR